MITKEMNFSNMNIKSFIDYIITFDNVDDILKNCKTQSEKGFIFERLFDIIIKFGFCDIFTNSNFNHLIGNSNNGKLKILDNLNQYLNEKVLSGNSGGCSDISLQNKNNDTKNLKLEYSTKTVKSTGTKTKIPLKYKLEDMLAIDTYTIKEGLMVKKITEKHPDMDKRKLIIANKSSFAGAFIDEGKLGLTGSDKTYIIGDNLELIQKMLKFKISDIISHYTKYRQDFLEKEVYNYLPDIRKLEIKDIDEKQFYKLIGLTQDEIKLFDKKSII